MLTCAYPVAPNAMAMHMGFAPESDLMELRALRRETSRSRSLDIEKGAEPALFGLLVVPVEFADTHFPTDWDPRTHLAPALSGGSESTLVNYFSVASGGKLEMRTTLAPIIRLSRERAHYSDLGTTYSLRTRIMATETLEALSDLGLEFRRLDMDGPDGIPASGDDDGQVDGVLFLHAGIGLENDIENGLIPAHQYFLTEPVVSDGVEASFYAVASHISGLGIWAHETGHLLGMEDRYDRRLQSTGGGEVHSRGGLGRFSLMASGAWGVGGGRQPALPDAYSCLQMGWVQPRYLDLHGVETQTIRTGLESGEVGIIWTNGEIGEEFFLVETRDPVANHPFDAAVPGGNLLVYHVDESRPEGYLIQEESGDWHLRVRMLEADGDGSLAAGLDDGCLNDLFPGSGTQSVLGPLTDPNSDGYGGPSGIILSEITSGNASVTLVSEATQSFAIDFSLAWSPSQPAALELKVEELGEPYSELQAVLSVESDPAWGSFQAGGAEQEFSLVESDPGFWITAREILWNLDPVLPAGATTRFRIRFTCPTWTSESFERDWVWSPSSSTLDFGSVWPGDWTVARPTSNQKTGWFRWDAEPWLTAENSSVLACVDVIYEDSSEWPAVRYNNGAYATITSGPLDPSVTGVRLTHAIEGEILAGSVAMDGGQMLWVAPDGTQQPAEPVDGWEAVLHNQVNTPIPGQGVLVGTTPFLRDRIPLWQTDVFSVPQLGNGPWRLRLAFASSASVYHHGWFVAAIDPLFETPPTSAFPIIWQGDSNLPGEGLTWSWPLSEGAVMPFTVEGYDPDNEDWYSLAARVFEPGPASEDYFLAADELLTGLRSRQRDRVRIRVVGKTPLGLMASRPVVIYPDGGPDILTLLGDPWPNPAGDGSIRFLAENPTENNCRLTIYNLAGRLIRSWSLPSGNHFLHWRGIDSAGRRVAAGVYFLRLEGTGVVLTRKVVLLH